MRTKVHKRVGIEDLKPTMELLDLSMNQLSVKLGYREGAVSQWLRVGNMPEVASLALIGLLSQKGISAPDVEEVKDKFLVILIKNGEKPKTLFFGDPPEQVKLLGKNYFLLSNEGK